MIAYSVSSTFYCNKAEIEMPENSFFNAGKYFFLFKKGVYIINSRHKSLIQIEIL